MAVSSRNARLAVSAETPSLAASSVTDGTGSPGAVSPLSTASRITYAVLTQRRGPRT
jgi:hypothetical protein